MIISFEFNQMSEFPEKIRLEMIHAMCPELRLPREDENGKFPCEFCLHVYNDKRQYSRHLAVKKRCRQIRQAVGLPIFRNCEYTCQRCGKAFASSISGKKHWVGCEEGKLKVIPINSGQEKVQPEQEAEQEVRPQQEVQ